MSDKLHIEIEFSDELNNVIPALIFLANELIEAGSIVLSSPSEWIEKENSDLDGYKLRWRFAEWGDEDVPITLEADIVDEIRRILSSLESRGTGSLHTDRAIRRLRSELETHLSKERPPLFAEMF